MSSYATDLRLGSLAYWALLALSTMPDHTSHAYALLQEFAKQFGRKPSSAALYQALQQLVRRELIRGRRGASLRQGDRSSALFTLTGGRPPTGA